MNWIEMSASLSWLAMTVACYVIGRRRGVSKASLAFVPLVGSLIVVLWSMPASLWFLLGLVVPVVLLVMLAVELPRRQGRSWWWTLGFLVPGVDLLVLYVYAFSARAGWRIGSGACRWLTRSARAVRTRATPTSRADRWELRVQPYELANAGACR